MRIAICEFRQESDSFNPVLTGQNSFERGGIHEGAAFLEYLEGKQLAVNGMVTELRKKTINPIMLYSMHTDSGGPVQDEIVHSFLGKTLDMIEKSLPLDGLLVSMHGATQSETIDDVCGFILANLRRKTGEKTVIAASFDLHANITDLIQKNTDFICGYQTYPHIDFFETGARAARLLLRALDESGKAATYRTVIPMIVPASSYTTMRGRFGELIHLGHSMVEVGKILDFSVFQMQPWLDVKKGGSCVVVAGENEKDAKESCRCLANILFGMRKSFTQTLFSIDKVIRKAEQNTSGKPVVLVDAADSPNAGACGDSPAVLERIKALNSEVSAAFYIADAKAISRLWDKDIGSINRIKLGATMCSDYYSPIDLNIEILSKHNGLYIGEGPAGRGNPHDCGRVITVRWKNVDIVICETISFPGDLQLYRHFGVEPTFYQLVNVKACTSFRVAYEPIASEICETETPGTAPINLRSLKFKKLPSRFFPFNNLDSYIIPDPVTKEELLKDR